MPKPVCVLWLNEHQLFEQALQRAGIADRFDVHGFALDQTILKLAHAYQILLEIKYFHLLMLLRSWVFRISRGI